MMQGVKWDESNPPSNTLICGKQRTINASGTGRSLIPPHISPNFYLIHVAQLSPLKCH